MGKQGQRAQSVTAQAWPARRWWMLAGLTVVIALGVVWAAPADTLFTARGTDTTGQFAAWRAFAADNLRQGHLPLWNPYTFSGEPFLGDFQSALLYPPNILFLFLPLERALNFSFLLHLLILGWGVGFWAARRGFHPVAAVAGGFAAMLSGPVFPHLYAGHLSNVCAMAWAPWILCGLEIAWRDKNFRALLLAAAAVCLQILAGHAQYVFYTAIAAGLQAVVYSFAEPAVRRRALPMAAVVYVFAALLAAAQLWPGLAAAAEGVRQGKIEYLFVRMFSFPPENLLTLVAPGFFGQLNGSVYWGRAYLWEMSLFTGVAGVTLALVALGDKASRRFVRADVILVVLLFMLALGDHTPLLRVLYDYVPGFGQFRGLSKFTFPAMLFGVLIIAAGADALIRRPQSRPWLAVGLTVFGIVLGMAGMVLWVQPERLAGFFAYIDNTHESYLASVNFTWPEFTNAAAQQSAHALAAGGALLCLLGAGLSLSPRWPLARWLPMAVLPVEMLVFTQANVGESTLQDAVVPDLHKFITAHPGDYRVLNLLSPNNGFLLGAPDIWGGNPSVLKRYAEFITFTQGGDADHAGQYVQFRTVPRIYSMLRLRFVFTSDAAKGPAMQVMENPDPLPRALLVPDYRSLPKRDAIFSALMEQSFDPRKTILLESEPAIKPQPDGEKGTVKVLASTTDSLMLEADTPAPALLLITDLYSRDWRVHALPGSSQPNYEIMPANYILRAIPLAAGHHNLVVEYAPASWRLGLSVSAAAWLAWLGAVFYLRKWKSQPAA